jgi:hypothetical protein
MGAISSLNLLKNDMGTDQAKALVSILKEHPTLKSLCGNKGDETELDTCGKMQGAADAIMLVPEIIGNGPGAVLSLGLSSNDIGAYYDGQQGKMIATPEGTLFPTHIHAIVLLTV